MLSLHYCSSILLFVTILASSVCSQEQQEHEYILEFGSSIETEAFLSQYSESIEKIRHRYDSDILTGTAIEFKNEKVAKEIVYDYPSILQAWPIHNRIRQQAPALEFKNNDKQSTTPFVPQDKDTLNILTQANNIHKSLKSNGKGIKIGIIDSGVDYTLPALGGCYGKGCKVAYGYDLVGNDFDGTPGSIKESEDPIDNCPANSTSATGHGTFVTGIIAAEDKQLNWNGIAPGATIGMWKVYGCNYPAAPNDIVIKAMEMAYKAKMDVISISLGVSGGWQEDILSVVADRIVSKGVHVITASGNIGTRGIFLTASPASAKNVIAAGSTMNQHVPGYILKLYNKSNSKKSTIEIPYRTHTSTALMLQEKLHIVPTSKCFDTQKDACKKLAHAKRFKDSIALIHEGGCDPLIKVMHARDAGAKAVIFYTNAKNVTTEIEVLNNAVLPVTFINHGDGYRAFKSHKAKFTNTLVAMPAPPSDLNGISSFSSLGPTNELDLKPELMAVGGNVFSTLPKYLKSYGFRSGTSFSTPYIAGSVALLLSNTQKDLKPDQAKNMLMNFATQVKGPIPAVQYGDSPLRQGAGVIDVTRAIGGYDKFQVLPAKLSFNDTNNFNEEQTITIYNKASTENTFELFHSPSLTANGYSLTNSSNYTPTEPIGLYGYNDSVALVEFSESKLVIAAGESVQVRVRIEPPTLFKADSGAMYGGYIMIKSTNGGEEMSVPYFGMIGNMIDLPILDRSSNPSPVAPFTFPAIGNANASGTVDPEGTGEFYIKYTNSSIIGSPYILTRLLTGTRLLQIQVLNKRGRVIGDVPMDGSRTYMMRNTLYPSEYSTAFHSWPWTGQYVPKDVTISGTNKDYTPKVVKNGVYRLKVKGLRVFGNPRRKGDWDEWTSPKLKLTINSS